MSNAKMFYKTKAAQIAVQSLDRIRREQTIGMIVANPGVGKSYTLKYWRSRQGARFRFVSIEADVLTSPRPILMALSKALDLGEVRHMYAQKEAIEQRLAGDPLMLIIDEADLLKVTSFELLRSIWDRVADLRGTDGERAFPMALIGTSHLCNMLDRDDLERLRRRVFLKAELPPLKSDELRMVLAKWGVRYDQEGFAELERLARGSFGWLNAIVPIAQTIAAKNGNLLSARVMRATSKHLFGEMDE